MAHLLFKHLLLRLKLNLVNASKYSALTQRKSIESEKKINFLNKDGIIFQCSYP